jgi:predicted transcriptional regulator
MPDSAVTEEDRRYMASEWAYFGRQQYDIAAEFGLTASSVSQHIGYFLTEARPDRIGEIFRYERRQLAREILGQPVARSHHPGWLDFGDLWVE